MVAKTSNLFVTTFIVLKIPNYFYGLIKFSDLYFS